MNFLNAQLDGLLGRALEANRRGRLSSFITGPESPAIAIFDPVRVMQNQEGDWYGEHAGKWLSAAARAFARSQDAELGEKLRRVAGWLIERQDADGYLGNYAPNRRFMIPQPPKPLSWNGEPALRTWDIWTHSYLMLGFLELHRAMPEPAYLDAARRIGDLCWRTLVERGIDITSLGNHHGMSATVLLDPAAELYLRTGEPRYLELAETILAQADAHPELALLSKALAGTDAAEIATGKAYQLAWNLVGLAKLYKATGRAELRQAIETLWANIREHHLSLGGGPFGGVANRSREVFNPRGTFEPQAYVETCSTLAWIQLNRELLQISGEARYAEEIERSAYNDLLGALAPNGEDWCYYSFANGKRVHTTYWRCCKSSGAMALEELPPLAYGLGPQGLTVNLYGPSTVRLKLPDAGDVLLEQQTGYPFDGKLTLRLAEIEHEEARFTLRLRIPAWAEGASLRLNGEPLDLALPAGDYAAIERSWRRGDELALDLPMRIATHRRIHQNVQESRAPDGSPVRQLVLHHAYFALSRGPLVYASPLIDGFKTEETIRLPDAPEALWLRELPAGAGEEGPTIELALGYRAPLHFQPYYRAGGRDDGAWRLTWLSLAPTDPASPASES
ncbi:glycoside hydrolase family 127 protein [Roseateles violae]|uniref:Glycoside hydrolase family 127 protein n=1 Tax=Roseateles violae TaxID=3058042 RepID=A0ABT8DWB8_9BURK|nr:beta-L-arabinofuranosidase domain-containing protein [Pelomonas sp. PFR6]MDN3921328.1 glycoside hydrolase family 127 protein [Pelomonas sp. PFR6]